MSLIRQLFAVFFVGFLALGVLLYGGSMVEAPHVMTGAMPHHVCPLMGTTVGCVNVSEHLAHWGTAFAVSVSNLLLALIFTIITVGVFPALFRRLWDPPGLRFVVSQRLSYLRALLPRHSLQEAFSSGVIHTKVF